VQELAARPRISATFRRAGVAAMGIVGGIGLIAYLLLGCLRPPPYLSSKPKPP
jgi:hypothetical protein